MRARVGGVREGGAGLGRRLVRVAVGGGLGLRVAAVLLVTGISSVRKSLPRREGGQKVERVQDESRDTARLEIISRESKERLVVTLFFSRTLSLSLSETH